MKLTRHLNKGLSFIENTVPSLMLIGTALLISLDVLMRYVFHMPVKGTGEIVVMLLVWQVMLGAAGVARDRGHISVEVITTRLTGVARAWWDALRLVITVAVVVFILYFGTQLFLQTSGRTVALLGLSRGVTTIAIPIGAALMLAYYGRDLIGAIRGIIAGEYQPPASRQVIDESEFAEVETWTPNGSTR